MWECTCVELDVLDAIGGSVDQGRGEGRASVLIGAHHDPTPDAGAGPLGLPS